MSSAGARVLKADRPILPLAAALLTAMSTPDAVPRIGPDCDWGHTRANGRQLDWILSAGLGPLLRWTASDGANVPSELAESLLAADLTARVRHAGLVTTAGAALDACRDLGVDATLLKGISLADRLYPAAHMRPMADVDVLVAPSDEHRVAEELLARGFERLAHRDWPGQHHGAPLRHKRLGTLVELHTALFPQSSDMHGAAIFQSPHVNARTQASSYHGRTVGRLRTEVQLAYSAASWFNDMTTYRFHPSFLVSLFDAVLLLKADGSELDWDDLLRSIGGGMAKASLYALLTYVPRFGIAPSPEDVLRQLAANRGLVGPVQRRLIHAVLDRYLVGGRIWSLPLPPPMPGRYSPRHQWKKRLTSGR